MAFAHDRVAQLLKRLDRQLGKLSSKPQPKNIHQFRTAARRVETLIAELVPEQDAKQHKLLKLIAKLRRRAGKVRDLDVQIAALRSLKFSEQPGIKTQLLQAMSEKRARRETRFISMLDKETIRELRRRLDKSRDPICKAASNIEALVRSRLASFTANEASISEDLLHQCRIEGKKIRYLAELMQNNSETQRTIEELKRMQDALGEWHDWLTLNDTVSKLLPDTTNSPLRAAIRNILGAKYRDAVQAISTAKANLLKQPASVPPTRVTERRAAAARAVA